MKYLLTIILIFIYSNIFSQELICNVRVLANQIQSSDKQKFNTLQEDIREFINNRKWTNEVFQTEERIEFSIMININEELSSDEYKGTIQIQYSRPVYNSSYSSPIFNYIDEDFQFKYIQFNKIEFNENNHTSNLSSVLSFYVYTIIALDYYSYSVDGGSYYMQKAQNIVNNAQGAQERGWKAYESNKNRYWIAEEILDAKYSSFTEVLYNYHRNGLDNMFEDNQKGRGAITESLELLRKIKRQNPTTFILQLFFDAKSSEITNIYSNAFSDEKARILNLLTELDPSNISKYNKIKEESQNNLNERM